MLKKGDIVKYKGENGIVKYGVYNDLVSGKHIISNIISTENPTKIIEKEELTNEIISKPSKELCNDIKKYYNHKFNKNQPVAWISSINGKIKYGKIIKSDKSGMPLFFSKNGRLKYYVKKNDGITNKNYGISLSLLHKPSFFEKKNTNNSKPIQQENNTNKSVNNFKPIQQENHTNKNKSINNFKPIQEKNILIKNINKLPINFKSIQQEKYNLINNPTFLYYATKTKIQKSLNELKKEYSEGTKVQWYSPTNKETKYGIIIKSNSDGETMFTSKNGKLKFYIQKVNKFNKPLPTNKKYGISADIIEKRVYNNLYQ